MRATYSAGPRYSIRQVLLSAQDPGRNKAPITTDCCVERLTASRRTSWSSAGIWSRCTTGRPDFTHTAMSPPNASRSRWIGSEYPGNIVSEATVLAEKFVSVITAMSTLSLSSACCHAFSLLVRPNELFTSQRSGGAALINGGGGGAS